MRLSQSANSAAVWSGLTDANRNSYAAGVQANSAQSFGSAIGAGNNVLPGGTYHPSSPLGNGMSGIARALEAGTIEGGNKFITSLQSAKGLVDSGAIDRNGVIGGLGTGGFAGSGIQDSALNTRKNEGSKYLAGLEAKSRIAANETQGLGIQYGKMNEEKRIDAMSSIQAAAGMGFLTKVADGTALRVKYGGIGLDKAAEITQKVLTAGQKGEVDELNKQIAALKGEEEENNQKNAEKHKRFSDQYKREMNGNVISSSLDEREKEEYARWKEGFGEAARAKASLNNAKTEARTAEETLSKYNPGTATKDAEKIRSGFEKNLKEKTEAVKTHEDSLKKAEQKMNEAIEGKDGAARQNKIDELQGKVNKIVSNPLGTFTETLTAQQMANLQATQNLEQRMGTAVGYRAAIKDEGANAQILASKYGTQSTIAKAMAKIQAQGGVEAAVAWDRADTGLQAARQVGKTSASLMEAGKAAGMSEEDARKFGASAAQEFANQLKSAQSVIAASSFAFQAQREGGGIAEASALRATGMLNGAGMTQLGRDYLQNTAVHDAVSKAQTTLNYNDPNKVKEFLNTMRAQGSSSLESYYNEDGTVKTGNELVAQMAANAASYRGVTTPFVDDAGGTFTGAMFTSTGTPAGSYKMPEFNVERSAGAHNNYNPIMTLANDIGGTAGMDAVSWLGAAALLGVGRGGGGGGGGNRSAGGLPFQRTRLYNYLEKKGGFIPNPDPKAVRPSEMHTWKSAVAAGNVSGTTGNIMQRTGFRMALSAGGRTFASKVPVVGVIGTAYEGKSAYDAYQREDYTSAILHGASAFAATVATAGAFVPGVGWAVAGAATLASVGLGIAAGKTSGDFKEEQQQQRAQQQALQPSVYNPPSSSSSSSSNKGIELGQDEMRESIDNLALMLAAQMGRK